jgi:D-tyrosyl-tRNA(Tyr) deacylase
MKAVIQRVTSASVSINHQLKSSIKVGYLVLLGIGQNDTIDDLKWLAKKIINLRVFPDKEDKVNISIKDFGGDVLLISQFTLFAQTKKGNRPSFIKSAKPEQAIPLYNKMIKQLELLLEKPIKT